MSRGRPTSAHDRAAATSLPTISERGNDWGKETTVRLSRQSANQYFDFGEPPNDRYDRSLPAYTTSISSGFPESSLEKLPIVKKEGFAKRGGWKRLLLILLAILLVIVALAVGLGVGLTKNGNKSASTSTESPPPASSSGSPTLSPSPATSSTSFPAGTYAIATFLNTVATDCTSNSSTWRCYPYSTYEQSPSDSAATFNWIIEAPSDGSSSYLISSTDNPFSISFSNVPLNLHDEGTPSERYMFQTQLEKTVVPSVAITDDGSTAMCNYTTTFQGTLYTSMNKTYPSSEPSSTGSMYVPWPYAVRVEQIAASGEGEPTCYNSDNNVVGNFSVSSSNQLCDCLYLNFGT